MHIVEPISFDLALLEDKIRHSNWWKKASRMVDSHHDNESSVMLTHHLEAVYQNVQEVFDHPEEGFYGAMFHLIKKLKLSKALMRKELMVVALLHDIGKIAEDKSEVIPHPLTGKAAHLRHGIVGQMATMEIIGADLTPFPQQQNTIYRTVELHDISYGMYRTYLETGEEPDAEKLKYISRKVHLTPGAGFLYLLLFKLADTHGHADTADVIWFYNQVKEKYFSPLKIDLPIPSENDIR
ncbi:MAG: hypothetical protein HYR66_08880 [Sphingobacteriales bacterium]|nr:hypothetical protein [Sphingobacteriales bacterium]MBI3720798.1 hypothetical protein [Sphingobacteriales bacterium]